jgi:hypothetical protein
VSSAFQQGQHFHGVGAGKEVVGEKARHAEAQRLEEAQVPGERAGTAAR